MALVTFRSERGHPGKSRGWAMAVSGFRASHWHPSLLLLLAALHLGLALGYHVTGTRLFAATSYQAKPIRPMPDPPNRFAHSTKLAARDQANLPPAADSQQTSQMR